MSDWEPLPQRKKRSRNPKDALNINSTENEIARNIELRSEKFKKEATLDGQDGCKGEFYEYLDHTADVQLHAWGSTLEEAFGHVAECMFNYMTDLSVVEVDFTDPARRVEVNVSGHDLHSLLFNYLDELLYHFCTDGFCCKDVRVESLDRTNETPSLTAVAYGEKYDQARHTPGTEVKAITYSNMQIREAEGRVDIYVIVDI